MTFLPQLGRRRELGALRLVREDSFLAHRNYPSATFRCGSPKAVFRFMEPYARRDETEVFWILALDGQQQVIWDRPLTVTRGIANAAMGRPMPSADG